MQLNVARTIAISPDESGDAFQFTLINFYVYARPSIHCLYFVQRLNNFTRQRKPTLCTLGLLGYSDREESANEKRMKESEALLLPFLSPLIQESDACRGSRPHSNAQIFDRTFRSYGTFNCQTSDFFVRLRQFRVNRKPKGVNFNWSKNRPTHLANIILQLFWDFHYWPLNWWPLIHEVKLNSKKYRAN